ncbi:MAG: hypothetical protein Q4E88_00785, partial [Coriobacteriia bacterium]|nr:hypothetical protein [Coriobacteriia bacterium]
MDNTKNKKYLAIILLVFALVMAFLFVGVSNATDVINNENQNTTEIEDSKTKKEVIEDKKQQTEDGKAFKATDAQNDKKKDEKAKNKIIGRIITDRGEYYDFQNSYDVKYAMDIYWINEPSLRIELYDNLNIMYKDQTINVPVGKKLTVDLGTHTLYSQNDDDSFQLINVEGTLYLNGVDEANYGYIQESNQNSTIKVSGSPASIHASYVNFTKPSNEDDFPSDGGHVYFENNNEKSSDFTNCYFTGYAKTGGSFYINRQPSADASINFTNCFFSKCKTTSTDGGAIYIKSNHELMNFDKCSFMNCNADDSGGAIATDGSDGASSSHSNYKFTHTLFSNCSCLDNGGAISSETKYDSFCFDDCIFDTCKCDSLGGAIYTFKDYTEFSLINTTIDGCRAVKGGGIEIDSNYATIKGNFNDDFQKQLGLSKNGQLTNGSCIINCVAEDYGGAIYTSVNGDEGNNTSIDHIDFINNRAENDEGGALMLRASSNKVTNCYFKNNTSDEDGGAIYIGSYGTDSSVKQCVFDKTNKSGDDYKGDYIYANNSSCHSNIRDNRVYHDSNVDIKSFAEKSFGKELAKHWEDCFEAVSQIDTYSVELYNKTYSINAGERLEKHSAERKGYSFLGWKIYWNDGTVQDLDYDFNYRIYYNAGPDQTFEIKAIWEPNIYEINSYDGTSKMETFYEKYDVGFFTDLACTQKKDKLTKLSKDNYRFDGYFYKDSENLDRPFTDEEGRIYNYFDTFSADGIVYTKWTPNIYEITLDNQDADEGHEGTEKFYQKYDTGFYATRYCVEKLETIEIPEKSEYNFDGYYTKDETGFVEQIIGPDGKFVTGIAPNYFKSNTTLYAKWEPKVFKLTLNDSPGTGGSGEIYIKYGDAFYYDAECKNPIAYTDTLKIPTNPGYKFCGYYTQGEQGFQVITEKGTLGYGFTLYDFTSDMTLDASWQNGIYTLELNSDGAEDPGQLAFYEKRTVGFFHNIECSTPFDGITLPKKAGYEFLGYFTKEGDDYKKQILASNGKLIEGISPSEFDTDTVLYAKWEAKVFKLTLNDDPGEGGTGEIYIKYGDAFYYDAECKNPIAYTDT